MTTLQEYLNQKYPTREDKEKVQVINIEEINWERKGPELLKGGELDLREFKNIENLMIGGTEVFTIIEEDVESFLMPLTKIDVNGLINLKLLDCQDNNLNSISFLNQLPNPEKLEYLWVSNNHIQPTDISIFSRFINLRTLKIGTMINHLRKGKCNKFYGSFKSFQNLTKLESICIEATDVNEGLEYLPFSLGKGYRNIECSPKDTNAKCSAIQGQLRPYDYDIEAWQLAHPHLMYEAKPELFFDPELKSKWLTALRDKTNKTQEKLNETKQSEPQAIKRIKRLEMKLKNLKLIQDNISSHSLIDKLQEKELVKKEDKATQTEEIKNTIWQRK